MIRTIIIFSGVVQMIGLQAQIKGIAENIGICGSAENLSDGTVKVICEAERTKINEMIRLIRSIPKPVDIKDMEIKEESHIEGMNDFVIIYGDMDRRMLFAMSTWVKLLIKITDTLDRIAECQERGNQTLERIAEGKERECQSWDRLVKGQERANITLKSIANKSDASL